MEDRLTIEENNASKYQLLAKEGKVVISPDNVSRVFAMAKDSPYMKKSYNIKDETSSAYKLHEWKTSKKITEESLLELIKRINAENSTHTTSKDCRTINNNILKNGTDNFLMCLEDSDYSIIKTMVEGCDKIRFSLATKICHYVSLFVLADKRDNFPIFDEVMRKNLNKYSDKWGKYSYRNKNYKDISDDPGLEAFYKEYVDCISELSKSYGVSKTGVEQLIWYYHNGGID